MEEATEKFKEITEAHTTLSDPNERSWYDSHREQVL
jgi:DnaJ family protein A protein 5